MTKDLKALLKLRKEEIILMSTLGRYNIDDLSLLNRGAGLIEAIDEILEDRVLLGHIEETRDERD